MHRGKGNSQDVEEGCIGARKEEGKAHHLCHMSWWVKEEHIALMLLNLVGRCQCDLQDSTFGQMMKTNIR